MRAFWTVLFLCITCSSTFASNLPLHEAEKTKQYWYNHGRNVLKEAQKVKFQHSRAKNVVLFVGDGMSLTTVTAARILKGQLKGQSGEEGQLYFESFPHVALIKTYNIDRQVPDSAGTATAFLTGVKANYETLGVNAHIKSSDSDCAAILENSVPSILQWAVESGKSAGVVTTTRITHATPAASYSHVAHRDWENNAKLPLGLDRACKDIARQLVENSPGNKLKVIMGGGRKNMLPVAVSDQFNSTLRGLRTDGRNLIEEWLNSKREQTNGEEQFLFVNSTAQLANANTDKLQYLMGLFNHDHTSYDANRDLSGNGEPSLAQMVEAAINVLKKDANGFVLLVEGGRIDHAHHDNLAKHALTETVAFDKAIQIARELLPGDDTLFIVTADHSHTLTINGYPNRGNPIFGLSDLKETNTNKSFTTLMYGNGPGHKDPRPDALTEPIDSFSYRQSSGVHLVDSAHGGEDVVLYSTGPMSYLFHSLHEQSYVAHVISFATCIGNYQSEEHCKCSTCSSSSSELSNLPALLLLPFFSLFRVVFSKLFCSMHTL